ncbi:hypothetical protein HMPREF3099_11080 [Kytococcus sp. HMSC28H12]|nr:hypothetical protein HMPREF3099_11080 [Kytococcus sp. HMSC28H12]
MTRPDPVRRLGRVEDLAGLLAVPGRAVVVCFTGSWCGSCSVFEPVFTQVAAELGGSAAADSTERVFALVDTQEVPLLATAWSVHTVPTVVVVRDGVTVHRIDGPVPARELRHRLRDT